MVGSIYYIHMPYSDFRQSKGRPVLVMHKLSKNDVLIMPLTSNLSRRGYRITQADIATGNLKKESVIVVPKLTAVDQGLLRQTHLIATVKETTFSLIKNSMCSDLNCTTP